MSWVSVNKPSVRSWTNVNPLGRETYDDATAIYDDSDVFYDGQNPNAWTNTAKPTTSSWVSISKPS